MMEVQSLQMSTVLFAILIATPARKTQELLTSCKHLALAVGVAEKLFKRPSGKSWQVKILTKLRVLVGKNNMWTNHWHFW